MQTFSFLLRTEVSVESLMQHKLYCLLLKRSIKIKKRSKLLSPEYVESQSKKHACVNK